MINPGLFLERTNGAIIQRSRRAEAALERIAGGEADPEKLYESVMEAHYQHARRAVMFDAFSRECLAVTGLLVTKFNALWVIDQISEGGMRVIWLATPDQGAEIVRKLEGTDVQAV